MCYKSECPHSHRYIYIGVRVLVLIGAFPFLEWALPFAYPCAS